MRVCVSSVRRALRRAMAIVAAVAGGVVVGAFGASHGSAQETVRPPAWIEASIREQVSTAWEIVPEAVVVEWGTLPRARTLASAPGSDLPAPELAGAGVRGEWIAQVPTTDGVVGIRVRTGVSRMVPVAAHEIERGTLLTPGEISYEERVHWGRPRDGGSRPEPGWRAERRIRQGEELRTPAVRPAVAVQTGDRVKVVWKSGSIQLTLTAVATGTARPGEVVTVRLDAGRRLTGVAASDGVVHIEGA